MESWVTDVVKALGLWAIALLMLLENVFPPIPSELIMPLAGYLSTQGKIGFWPAVLSGTLGSMTGATFWYLIGRRYSDGQFRRFVGRHGIWFALDVGDYDRAQRWFERHGGAAVFFGRLIPAVRTLISVPAGLSGMRPGTFLAWTALGTAIWTFLLAWLGRFLGERFTDIGRWIDPVSTGIVILLVLLYLIGVARKLRSRRKTPD